MIDEARYNTDMQKLLKKIDDLQSQVIVLNAKINKRRTDISKDKTRAFEILKREERNRNKFKQLIVNWSLMLKISKVELEKEYRAWLCG